MSDQHRGHDARGHGHGGHEHHDHRPVTEPAKPGYPEHPELNPSRDAPEHSAHEHAHGHGVATRPAATRHTGHEEHTGHEMPAGHAQRADHAGHAAHAGHDKHAGHSVAMFRDKFWISLLLTLPTLVWGHMLQSALGYTAPHFPGSHWIPPVFGTAVFAYGGWVFIQGAVRELKDRLPG